MIRQITFSKALVNGAKHQYLTTNPLIPIATKSIVNVRQYSILDTAKGALDKLNKGAGKLAADGLDITEKATKSTGEGVNEVNKKTAETLQKVNKKTGKVLADGIEVIEEASERIKDAKDQTFGKPEHKEARKRVKEHHKGYKDLQDKGRKTESEQNRPDDAV
ncbi:uncharacterized protein RJT21DRAFT_120835 [Scheffersomyces amazonensis]|uniref:uncharacterized protein n=1 Tax=Scheffersomyces amazonensis TaxID=1078765 RepID=UPI00315D7DFB